MTLPQAAVGTLAIVVLAAVLWPVPYGHRRSSPRTQCVTSMKQVAIGSLLYQSDHDERFPDAQVWCDALYPYIKTKDIYRCSLIPGSQYSQAMHDRVSLVSAAKLSKPETRLVFFESAARIPNAHGDESLFPKPSPHGDGNIVAYADAHARWLPRTKL